MGVHMHDRKTDGDRELMRNETVQHNLVTGGARVPEGGAWFPADAGLDITVGNNVNASSSSFSVAVDREQMLLTFHGDSVLDKTGCQVGGPGGDVDFTGGKRGSKCVPGPVDGLVAGKLQSVSLWPAPPSLMF